MTSSSNSSLILCSTPRLARSLQRLYQREQIKQGLTKWQPLNAMPLSAWLKTFVDDAVMLGYADTATMPACAQHRRALLRKGGQKTQG